MDILKHHLSSRTVLVTLLHGALFDKRYQLKALKGVRFCHKELFLICGWVHLSTTKVVSCKMEHPKIKKKAGKLGSFLISVKTTIKFQDAEASSH